MVTKRLFDYDPITQTTKWFYYDDETEEVKIETSRDVEDLKEQNQFSRNQYDERSRWDEEYNRVASIPDFIYYQLMAEGKLDDEEYMKKWLNDSDNAAFRTRPGRI